VGGSLSVWTAKGRKLFPDATLVQSDHDARAFDGPTRPDVTVLADAGLLTAALLDRCAGPPAPGWSDDGAHDRLARRRPEDDLTGDGPAEPQAAAAAGGLDPRRVCVALGEHLPPGRRLTTDSGHHFGFPAQHVPVDHPDRYHHTSTFGAIGQGLGVAIGAAFVGPPRTSVVVLGDGGLATSIADLETAVRERAPVLVVVLDDRAYGAEIHHLRRAGIPDELGRFDGTDLTAVARGFGCEAVEVATLEELAAAVAGWSGVDPLVVTVPIDGDVLARWYDEVLPPAGH